MIYSKFFNKKSKLGFTLIELLIVTSVVTILSAVVLRRQATFQTRFEIDQKAADLSLAIRQAQAYSIGVKEFYCDTDSTKTFSASYGIYLNAATKNQFISFIDVNKDGKYTASDTGKSCYTKTTAFSTLGFNRVCGAISSGAQRCSNNTTLALVTITFNRPNPKPILKFMDASGTELTTLEDLAGSPNPNAALYVYFKYPNQTGEVEVKIDLTGQVAVRYI